MDYTQIAKLQYETQLKMRKEFVDDFMKHIHFRVDEPEFEEQMRNTIREIIETSYNKGSHDTMDIIMEVDLALAMKDLDMKGGEDYDV